MEKYTLTLLKNLSVIICMLLGVNNLFASTVSTTGLGDGKWSSTTTWSSSSVPTKDDNVTINHSIDLDANWGPQNSGSIMFNATSSGSGTLNMSGGTLDIRANVTLSGGGINLTGGTIYVRSGYTLIMPGFNQANTNIVVEAGAAIIINGNLLDNHGNIQVDGLITVNGNYNGQASNATVTGTGNITTTGSMVGINGSSIFGTINPNCPSNCDGKNLFGGGNCYGTAVAIPNVTSICSGGTVSFTSSLTNGYGNEFTKQYQWQIKNSSNLFVNISGATTSTYSASPSVSSDYRVIIGEKQNSGDAYCYKFSPSVNITVTSSPTAVAGTAITSCAGAGAKNITTGCSASNYSSVSWSCNGTGTFTSSGSLTNATYNPSAADIIAGSVTLTLTAYSASCGTATSTKTFTINAVPVITSTTPGTRCGAGSVALSAASSAGTLNWYAGSSGGSSLGTGTTFNTPSISATTVYYVAATNLGCVSARTAVTATIDNICAYTWTGATSTVWNLGSNWDAGNIPTSSNDVIIPSSVVSGRMPTASVSVAVKSLNNAGTITLASSGAISVYGNIVNTGTITMISGSTISMVGTSAQTITGLYSVYNLNINNGSGVSLLSSTTVNGALSLMSGALTTNNHLVINFDGGGNIAYNVSDSGSISGNVTGTRILIEKTHWIASPFLGVTISQIKATTPVYRALNKMWLVTTKRYDTQGWFYIKDSTTTGIIPSVGYSLAMFNAAPLTFTGTYNHGSNYNSGNYSNVIPSNITQGMYIMVGNPYPSTLDWDNASGWTKTNIDDAIYFWNPATSSMASYVSGAGTNGATQYIGAMQAFMVSVTGTGGMSSLVINNNARVLTNASYFRSTSNQMVRLAVRNTGGTSIDETVVRIDDQSSSDFESGSDAYKVHGALSLYTQSTAAATTASSPDYSINTLPISGPEMVIPLNLKVASDGLYTIECKEYFVPGYSMILEDKRTQSSTVMDNSMIYTINASRTDSSNRFILRFVPSLTTGVLTGSVGGIQISTYDNQMMLSTGGIQTDHAVINIYDASGLNAMRLDNQRIAPGIQTMGLPGLARGVYIVKIDVDGTNYVGKVVLK